MPFFPQAYLSQAHGAEPTLFDILSALDAPRQKSCAPQQQQRRRQETFTPRFDVTETAEAYELYGDVPGLEQDNLSIEFSDAQTLVVKGHVGRTPVVQAAVNNNTTANDAEVDTSDAASEKAPSHAATVEDDYDEADTPLATPASTVTATNDEPSRSSSKGKGREETAPQQQTEQTQPQAKYWIAERRVGEFARSFSFEQRVEADFVTAGLRNGVLHVVVPKSLRSRKVVVSVN